MKNKIKRPISVWLTQGVLIIFALVAVLYPIRHIQGKLDELSYYNTSLRDASAPLIGFIIAETIVFLPIILISALAFWGLLRRKRYGRWLTIAIFLIWIILRIIDFVRTPVPRIGDVGLAVGAQARAELFEILIAALTLFLLYRLVMGKAVSNFFARETPVSTDPPPPPTFDS